MAPDHGIGRMLRRLTQAAEVLSIACVAVIAAIVVYEIAARFLFNAPTSWSQELSVYLLLWLFFLGLAPAERADKHIRIDLLYTRLPLPVRRWLGAGICLGVAAFALVAAWSGVEIVLQSLRLGRRSLSLLSVPVWIPQLALCVGMTLLALESTRRACVLWRGDPAAEA